MGVGASSPADSKLPDVLSVPVSPSGVVDGQQTSPVLRGASCSEGALKKSSFPDATTLYAALQRGLRLARDQPCLGNRIQAADGTLTTEYEWKTYEEVAEIRDVIGS